MTAAQAGDLSLLRPLPDVGGDGAPFWEAARDHRLVVQRCLDCGRLLFPPEVGCFGCGSPESEWVQMSGRGRLYSWTIAHPPVLPYFAQFAPVPIVVVELDEGPRIVSVLVGVSPADYRVDLPVIVDFEDAGENATLVVFRPA
jgi:uncharacterized OB-fold protein